MIKKSTYTLAFEACEDFFADTGQMPTIEAIKPVIGVNSPSIISSAIKDWKSALAQAVRQGQGLNPGVPKALLDALAGVWAQALEEAQEAVKDKAGALEQKQAALDAQEAAQAAETVRVGQLVQLTEQKFQEEIGYLKMETGRLAAEAQAATQQAQQCREAATAAETKNAVLVEEIRQEKEKFRRLESQYDKEHEWALKRIAEEKESHRQQTQHEMARLQSETKRSKQDLEMLQAKQGQLLKHEDDNRGRISRLEASLAEGKLKLAELTLDKANLQSELNAKEERIRVLITKTANKEKKR